MDREKIRNDIHLKMLEKSFHRKEDEMTSILLGNAVSIATEYITSRTCKSCKYCEYGLMDNYEDERHFCTNKKVSLDEEYFNIVNIDFGCNEWESKNDY